MMVAWTKVETVQLMRSDPILNGLMVNKNNNKKVLMGWLWGVRGRKKPWMKS